MSFDAHKNFAVSTVAIAPVSPGAGTSLVVAAGDGAKFPVAPFNVTIWPVGVVPTTLNAEVARVTNVTSDTLTITRAQESSSARVVLVGDQIANTITAKALTDVETVADGAVPKSLADAKGDLFTGTANDTVARLAVGTNGYRLLADSSQTAGVKWVAPRIFNVMDPPYNATGDNSTDDTAAIQAAIDAAELSITNNRVGAVVYLPAGTYRTTAPLVIQLDGVTFMGDGRGKGNDSTQPGPKRSGTTICPKSTFSGTQVLKVGNSTYVPVNVWLRDFNIIGTSLPGTSDGITFSSFRGGMEDVWVRFITGNGINLTSIGSGFPIECSDCRFYNVECEEITGNGWQIDAYAGDHIFTACTSRSTTGHGFNLAANAAASIFDGCYAHNCTGKGFLLAEIHEHKWTGCRIQDTNGGIYFTSTGAALGGFRISGCTFRNCSLATNNTTDGINIAPGGTVRGGTIVGCDFTTDAGNGNGGGAGTYNRMRYGINIANSNMQNTTIGPMGSTYNSAVSTFGTAPINDAGTATVVSGGRDANLRLYDKLGNDLLRLTGTSTPEASVTAPTGSLYQSTSGVLYRKITGTGNTGWAASPVTLAQSAVQVSHTGDTNEFTFATITVPANSMGANGRVRVTCLVSLTNSANNKTFRVRFGGASGTQYFNSVLTTNATYRLQSDVANRNATNSQAGGPAGGTGSWGGSSGAVVTSAVDTTADTTIVITGQLANTGETVSLEHYLVELLP